MPGPMVHLIFYRQLKARLSRETDAALPAYDDFSIFAQGHDLLIYHDFYKIAAGGRGRLYGNIELSRRLQEERFPAFIAACLEAAQALGALEDPAVRLFIGPGYAAHHLLDAYTHPFLIYSAGDHIRNPANPTWAHGIAENLLDIHMMEAASGQDCRRAPVHRAFAFRRGQAGKRLEAVLDRALEEVYGFSGGGALFCRAMSQVRWYMRMFKYDPTGVKARIFDGLDPLLKGTASFSYHRDAARVRPFLNEIHREWRNPMDGARRSRASFRELYDAALEKSAEVVERLDAMCRAGRVSREAVLAAVPDIAATHGLACGQPLTIQYTGRWEIPIKS